MHKEETAISSEEPADVTALQKVEADKCEGESGNGYKALHKWKKIELT